MRRRALAISISLFESTRTTEEAVDTVAKLLYINRVLIVAVRMVQYCRWFFLISSVSYERRVGAIFIDVATFSGRRSLDAIAHKCRQI